MSANLRKGPLHNFLFLFAHNFKIVIATGLKPGVAILQSLQYTRYKFRTPPTSGLVVAIMTRSKISHFMAQVGAPPFQVRR